MNALKQSSLLAVLTMMFLGVSACSDKVGADKLGENVDKSTEAGKEQLATSTDTRRNVTGKADAAFNDMTLAARVKAEILKDASLRTSDIM